jgi:hypothetical protein
VARRHRSDHATGLYDGEHHDARLEVAGWSTAAFDDRRLAQA